MLEETLWWWMIAVILVLIRDLNVIEFAMIWLGWRYRERIFTAPLFLKVSGMASRVWRWLSVRPVLACVLIGCAPIVVRVALLPIFPVPEPIIPDEFSHLLLADTFLHGRLTNPMHPLWIHFESIHIIQRPTYNSMYFPAQAVALLAGALAGHVWLGVLLVTGLMCGFIVWALQPFMPNRWAILAGVIAAVRFGVVGYWVNSYWGGSLAALGGAIVLGCYGRIRRKPSFPLGILLGIGLGIIGIVRPLEGLTFAAPFVFALCRQLWVSHRHRISFTARTAVPAVVVLAILFTGLGVFFKAVTGNPFTPGYAVNQKEYGWPLVLPWQKAVEPAFRHKEMKVYYDWEKDSLKRKDSVVATVAYGPSRFSMGWTFFFGPVLSIGLFHLRSVVANRRMRAIVVSGLACCAVVFWEAGYPHYLAPATVCLLAIAVEGLRYARVSRRGTFPGRLTIPLAMTILSILVGAHVIAARLKIPYAGESETYLSWCCASNAGQERKTVENAIAAQPGSHVILVGYHHAAWESREWVYNGADIDGSRIIWARDMGPERNQELIRYYPGRRFWIVDADDKPAVARTYKFAPAAGSTVADSGGR